MEAQPDLTLGQKTAPAYLDVSRTPDGRYCVVFVKGGISRRSYAPTAEQVLAQARHAGDLAVRTDDSVLRGCCQEAGVTLLDNNDEDTNAVSRLV